MEWKDAIPLALLVLGWLVVHRLTVKRDKLNSLRQFCIETRCLVESIEKNACKYHTEIIRDINLEPILKTDLNKLDARINWLPKKIGLLPSYIIEFRQAITSENFETIDFEQKLTTDKLVQRIFLCSTNICEKLYKYELD